MEKELAVLIEKLEVVEFIGLATFLKVELLYKDKEENNFYPFVYVYQKILDKFNTLSKRKKRELLNYIEESIAYIKKLDQKEIKEKLILEQPAQESNPSEAD